MITKQPASWALHAAIKIARQKCRFRPARVLGEAKIPCLVWGEDVLEHAYHAQRSLFESSYTSPLELVVPDHDVTIAVEALINSSPAYRIASGVRVGYMTGQVLPVPNPQLIYPHSSCVKPHVKSQDEQDDGTPEAVYLHPQSKVFFDVLDKQRSEPLPLPDLDTLRIPTLTAFLDSIIGLILDPSPRGPRDNLDRMMWELWITVLYKGCKQLRRQKWWKENHKLRPQTLEVMRKLRPENQPYFAAFTETGFEGRPYDGHIKTRQALLSTLGRREDTK